MRNKIGIGKIVASAFIGLSTGLVQADMQLAGWDRSLQAAPSHGTAGIDGAASWGGETNGIASDGLWGHEFSREDNDGTFGTLAPLGATDTARSWIYKAPNGSTSSSAYLEYAVTNNGTQSYELTRVLFDSLRVNSSPENWSLSIVAGDVALTNDIATGTFPKAGLPTGATDYPDYDVSLEGLTDNLLDPGESVTFRLDFTDASPASGSNLYIDNVAILGTVPVTNFVAQMYYRPVTFGVDQAYYEDYVDYLKSLGYNTVQIAINGRYDVEFTSVGTFVLNEFSRSNFTALIQYTIDQGLEPVVQFPLASKIYDMVVPLTNSHPNLLDNVTGKTHDPYYQFDSSTDMLAGIYKPIIDWIVGSYPASHPCQYINLAGDEFDTDSLQTFGENQGVDASQAFAKIINDIVDYARVQNNLKVVLWGDKFLSLNLGNSTHGINGWTADSRFIDPTWKWNSMNADRNPTYPLPQKESVSNTTRKVVNYINHKENIIIADWHYRDANVIQTSATLWEYPSVDYFQSLGFDSVWTVAWGTEFDEWNYYNNARMFAKYSASKNVGGHLATIWYMDYPGSTHYFNAFVILEDSIKFMENPEGIRTLSQFSMTNYSKSSWIDVLQNSPASYTIATGGSETSPVVRADYLYLDVEAGAKGVGIICTNANTIVQNADFGKEVRMSLEIVSTLVDDAQVRMLLIEDDSNFLSNYLFLRAVERANGITFGITQKGGTNWAYTPTGLSLGSNDIINVYLRDNTITKFEFVDYVDATTSTTYDILALSGWNGSISSSQTQFPNGAYTMLELLSPSGAAASIQIGRVVTEVFD